MAGIPANSHSNGNQSLTEAAIPGVPVSVASDQGHVGTEVELFGRKLDALTELLTSQNAMFSQLVNGQNALIGQLVVMQNAMAQMLQQQQQPSLTNNTGTDENGERGQ